MRYNEVMAENNVDPFDCDLIEMHRVDGWQDRGRSAAANEEISRRGFAREAGLRGSLVDKLDFASRVISRLFTKTPNVAVSYSAGGDSTMLSHFIVAGMGKKPLHVMSNTRVEYPETVRNAKRWEREFLTPNGVELAIAWPDKRPPEVWEEQGIPLWSKHVAAAVRGWQSGGSTKQFDRLPEEIKQAARRLSDAGVRVSEKCCDELKKKPMMRLFKERGIEGTLTGSRAQESMARQLSFLQVGALYDSRYGYWIGTPLVYFTADDVAAYHKRHGIEMERPDNGSGRSGCVTCAFGCHLPTEGGLNSMQKLGKTNPRLHAIALDDWGYREALDIAGIKYDPPEYEQLNLFDI